MTRTRRRILKRYAYFLAGLLVLAFGVAFSIKAYLGTSPVSAPPYVVSEFTPITVGCATIIMHLLFIAGQWALLGKKYKYFQLMQLPVAFAFGYMTDLAMWTVRGLEPSNYLWQWVFCLIGVLLVGIGVAMEVIANVVVLAGEGIILALCEVTGARFHLMKVIVDTALVAVAAALSFIFLGKVIGVREGTLAAAWLVGPVARKVMKIIGYTSRRILT